MLKVPSAPDAGMMPGDGMGGQGIPGPGVPQDMAGPDFGGMDMAGGADPFGGNQGQDGMLPPPGGDDAGFNPYDTNFDPGVEADEETDPKRFIQQLTGKLSQSLRSYNQSLPQPDTDLSKYVAGMILKQTAEGIPQGEMGELLSNAEDGSDDADETNESSVRHGNILGGGEETSEPSDKSGRTKRTTFTTLPFTSPSFDRF